MFGPKEAYGAPQEQNREPGDQCRNFLELFFSTAPERIATALVSIEGTSAEPKHQRVCINNDESPLCTASQISWFHFSKSTNAISSEEVLGALMCSLFSSTSTCHRPSMHRLRKAPPENACHFFFRTTSHDSEALSVLQGVHFFKEFTLLTFWKALVLSRSFQIKGDIVWGNAHNYKLNKEACVFHWEQNTRPSWETICIFFVQSGYDSIPLQQIANLASRRTICYLPLSGVASTLLNQPLPLGDTQACQHACTQTAHACQDT